MARRPEDPTIWIGYADFLSTLAILFFILIVGLAARVGRTGTGMVMGTIADADTAHPVSACEVILGANRRDSSDSQGRFKFEVDSMSGRVTVGLSVRCKGYEPYRDLIAVRADSTSMVAILVSKPTSVTVDTLPGDALFERNAHDLKPQAVGLIAELGGRLRRRLSADEVIAVQGHTDDVDYPLGAGKDNWVLSAERAAAAARVLSDVVGIPRCQIVIMGFGPSRPVAPVSRADSRHSLAVKRAKNRRIEFRLLRGRALAGDACAA